MVEEKICRLCFNSVKNEFEVIDAVTKQMLDVLSLKVDLNATKSPILCRDCAEITTRSYYFKLTCIDTEELILSFSASKEGSEIDIKDVYVQCKDVKIVTNEDLNICRYCMNQMENSNCISMDILMNDELYVKMLPVLMPKMDLNIVKDPVICTSCKENLECYFKFIQKCLDAEDKLDKYRKSKGICGTDQIKLSSVLGVLFKDALEYSEKCSRIPIIKQENLLEEIEVKEDFIVHEEQVKCEGTLDVKRENAISMISCESLLDISIDKCEVDVSVENSKIKLEIHNESMLNYETNNDDSVKRNTDILDENNCKVASNVKMYKCGICSYETKSKKYLTNHMLTHKDPSEVVMYKCEICTYETKYKRSLKAHQVVHKETSDIEMYKCGLCIYQTKYKYDLKRHMLTHNYNLEVKMYKCETCTYETKYKNALKSHILMHKDVSEIVMHKCELCDFETKYKNNIKIHMQQHKDTSEVEMHKCELCTYKTKYKNNLKIHMDQHKDASEVKMYTCEICHFRTRYKNNLKMHLHQHKDSSQIEIHECELCSFNTRYKKHLKGHMLIHKNTSEVEMYKCGICVYETRHKGCLKKHRLTHKESLEVEVYKCKFCDYETKYKYNIKEHMLIHMTFEK